MHSPKSSEHQFLLFPLGDQQLIYDQMIFPVERLLTSCNVLDA